MTDILWCCHVRGPDDVHAAPDYETALKWSDYMNDTFGPHTRTDENFPIIRAAPAIWPWSAEAHAENLPKSIRGFTRRCDLPQDDPDYMAPTAKAES